MTLLVLFVLAILAGRFQNAARDKGHADPFTAGVRAAAAPGVKFTDDTNVRLRGFFGALASSEARQVELDRLRQFESAAKIYGQTVEGLRRDMDQLRKLHDLPNFGRSKVGARVIGYFPFENRFTLSAGTTKGVAVGMAVVSPQGLLGLVQTADKDTCQAYMTCSPTVTFGGMVQRYPEVLGLVKGQTPTRLVLDVLDNGMVEVGDPVVTSGLSPRIPRGIPVGTVAEVVPDPSYGTKRVFVSPAASIGPTLEVWILK